MIFYFAICFLFVDVSAISTGRVDLLVFPSVETSRSGVKTVKFRALNEEIELKLEPAGEILAENFALLDANDRVRHSIDVEDLKKKIYRDSSNGAALLIDEDGPVTIQGIVNSNLRIEPYESGRTDRDGRIPHQIVEVISDKNYFGHDGVMPLGVKNTMKSMARDDQCIVVEYLVLTESNVTKKFKTEKSLTEYISVTYTAVQNMFDTLELGIKARVLGITSFTEETEPVFVKKSEIPGYEQHLDPREVVYNMRKFYWSGCRYGLISIFIVSRKMGIPQDDNTVSLNYYGMAYLGMVCHSCYKVGVTRDDSDHIERAAVIAHESGHLLGSPHDGEEPKAVDCPGSDGYIMGGRDTDKKNIFSSCSKKAIKDTLSLIVMRFLWKIL
ncbi:venom metalloproteinase antarease TserMP_A-like [Centruroides vittatus]|uniref:venom metalloproteinase antarease TserMP_A-like n=1 Tax=Centruroides vittatus TaxID=120091 RepID=UPI00350F1890